MTSPPAADTAVVLIAHGTVESLEDLPEFLANIRRGHAAPPELVAEVRRRYEAIGGRSPLNDITRDVAKKLEARVGLPTRIANRLFRPYPKDVIAELAGQGIRRIVTVPLAQHSAGVYGAAMTAAAQALDPSLEVLCAPNWGRRPELTAAFADAVLRALGEVPAGAQPALVFTAHSLPLAIVRAGDPYEVEVRASADDVAALIRARGGAFSEYEVAFQSQGIGSAAEWLGPELLATLDQLRRRGRPHIVLAPIGFLADHVEILYDLDIEAKAWAGEHGTMLYRSASLNGCTGLIDALAAVTGELLAGAGRSTSDGADRASSEKANPRPR